MNEKINEVQNILTNPVANRLAMKVYVKELCNYNMNLHCGQCINESVILLSNWLKEQGVNNDYKSLALQNKYELKKINLFVQVYDCENTQRKKELDTCLKINKDLNINGVVYLNVIEIKEKLKFSELFNMTKGYPNDINIIANSDIYFNETILESRFIKSNEAWALTRWDYSKNIAKLFYRKDSQDVWVFNGVANVNGGDYYVGTPGCDNRLAFEIKNSGYDLINPSKRIHAIHLHETNYRTYDKFTKAVEEPYHFIFPHY